MVDITRDKPIKVAVRVVVPVRDHPKFNFVGKLLGPKGNSLKRLQEDTMCKMAVLGRGSMKDRHKEEELRASGDPKFQHLSEELHVEISAFATPAEAHARIAYALAEVRRFLVPDYNDDIRQEQMWEMQVLSSQRNSANNTDTTSSSLSGTGINCGGGGGGVGTSSTGDCVSSNGDDRLSGGGDSIGHEMAGLQSPNADESSSLSPTAVAATSAPATAHPTTGLQAEHPALRGINTELAGSSPPHEGPLPMPANGAHLLPSPNGLCVLTNQANSPANGNSGRKRPLLASCPRTSMTPTKRTVMSLLARARAAQAKQLPSFQRASQERTPTLVPLLREDYITGAVNLNMI